MEAIDTSTLDACDYWLTRSLINKAEKEHTLTRLKIGCEQYIAQVFIVERAGAEGKVTEASIKQRVDASDVITKKRLAVAEAEYQYNLVCANVEAVRTAIRIHLAELEASTKQA